MLLDDKTTELFVRRSSKDGRTGDIVSVVQAIGADPVVGMNIKKMGYFPMDELEFHKIMTGEILKDKMVDEKPEKKEVKKETPKKKAAPKKAAKKETK